MTNEDEALNDEEFAKLLEPLKGLSCAKNVNEDPMRFFKPAEIVRAWKEEVVKLFDGVKKLSATQRQDFLSRIAKENISPSRPNQIDEGLKQFWYGDSSYGFIYYGKYINEEEAQEKRFHLSSLFILLAERFGSQQYKEKSITNIFSNADLRNDIKDYGILNRFQCLYHLRTPYISTLISLLKADTSSKYEIFKFFTKYYSGWGPTSVGGQCSSSNNVFCQILTSQKPQIIDFFFSKFAMLNSEQKTYILLHEVGVSPLGLPAVFAPNTLQSTFNILMSPWHEALHPKLIEQVGSLPVKEQTKLWRSVDPSNKSADIQRLYYLSKLKNKVEQFKQKSSSSKRYTLAYDKADALYKKLSTINNKTEWVETIKTAKKDTSLATHRGMKDLFAHLLLIASGIGIFYLAAKKYQGGSIFSPVTKTDTINVLDELEEKAKFEGKKSK